MPQLFQDRVIPMPDGIVCDCCGKRCEANGSDGSFVIKHVCGYGSVFDMGVVSFALCDDCLLRLAAEYIPGAVFEDGSGAVNLRQAVMERLTARLSRN